MQGTDPPSIFEMRSAVMVSGSLSEGPGVEGRIFDRKVIHSGHSSHGHGNRPSQ